MGLCLLPLLPLLHAKGPFIHASSFAPDACAATTPRTCSRTRELWRSSPRSRWVQNRRVLLLYYNTEYACVQHCIVFMFVYCTVCTECCGAVLPHGGGCRTEEYCVHTVQGCSVRDSVHVYSVECMCTVLDICTLHSMEVYVVQENNPAVPYLNEVGSLCVPVGQVSLLWTLTRTVLHSTILHSTALVHCMQLVP